MAYNLLKFRVRVKVDAGSQNTGVIVESPLGGYSGLLEFHPSGDPEIPDDPPTLRSHILFEKEAAEEVDIGGETFVILHMHSILAYIED